MTKKAAEYYGRCQACDRLQKLPDGVLAKHGYQVIGRGNQGYFAGTCKGSGHNPYEEDCTWIKNFLIPQAKDEENRLIEFISELRLTPKEPKAYHQCYGRFGSYWQEVQILMIDGRAHLQLPVNEYDKNGLTPLSRYTWLPRFESDLLKVAAAMNEYFIEHDVKYDLRRIQNYIIWQESRVADWKLRPLPPVHMFKELKKQSEKAFHEREASFVSESGEAA